MSHQDHRVRTPSQVQSLVLCEEQHQLRSPCHLHLLCSPQRPFDLKSHPRHIHSLLSFLHRSCCPLKFHRCLVLQEQCSFLRNVKRIKCYFTISLVDLGNRLSKKCPFVSKMRNINHCCTRNKKKYVLHNLVFLDVIKACGYYEQDKMYLGYIGYLFICIFDPFNFDMDPDPIRGKNPNFLFFFFYVNIYVH